MTELTYENMNNVPGDAEPSAAPAWPQRLWDWKTGWAIMLLWIVLFVIANVAQGIALVVESGGPEALAAGEMNVGLGTQLVTIIGFAIAALGSVFVVARFAKRSWADLGFIRPDARWMWIGAGVGLALAVVRMGLLAGVVALFPELAEGTEALAAMMLNNTNPLTLIISGVLVSVIVPFYEEVFSRGYYHNWLRNRLGFWAAAVISSAFFALIHLIPLQMVSAFLLGLGMAWVYENGKSIWPVIVAHAVNNFIAWGVGVIFLLLGLPMM